MGDSNVVEMIPDRSDWPDWARDAFDGGTFFATAIEIVKQQQIELGHAEATIITLRRELKG